MPGGPAIGPLPQIAEYLSQRSAAARQNVITEQQAEETPNVTEEASTVRPANRGSLSQAEVERDVIDDLKSKGINVGQVTAMGMMPALVDNYKNHPGLYGPMVTALSQNPQFAAQVTSQYATLATGLGFSAEFTPKTVGDQPTPGANVPPIHARGPGMAGGLPEGSPMTHPLTSPAGDFQTNEVSGGIRYQNGVVANPQTGEIAFPPGADTPGSALWFNNVVMKWSPEQVMSWKKKLVEKGFLPKDVLKGKTAGDINQSFQSGLMSYWQAYYLNYGQVLDQDETAGGYGGQSTITNLKNIRQGISNDVSGFYRDLYGVDPSDAELDHWTNQVIKMGNRLQRAHDLDPGTAATEAKARVIDKISNTPEAKFFTENMEENTRLRDMIVRSVQVASGMSR